jgi:uncharacterized protein
MSNFNSVNRAVWFDIPVSNLDRAAAFYSAVLNVAVNLDSFNGIAFGVIEHHEGNGGCLVINESDISAGGVLLYLNVNGRIRDAVLKVGQNGGSVLKPVHAIGPHGFRAVVLDSEGNRVALHSESDA